MRKSLVSAGFVLAILLLPTSVFGANLVWPATGSTNIPLTAPYEPSGLAWNSRTNKLFSISDPTSDGKNRVTMMNVDGSNQVEWKGGGDYEALTFVDPNSNYIYVGVENAPAILEFDCAAPSSSPRITKSWALSDAHLSGMGNSGLEGLAFVPNEFHNFPDSSSGGLFYVGVQREYNLTDGLTTNNSSIFVYDVNLSVSNQYSFVAEITMDPSLPKKDVSDLYFNRDTGTLFVLYDDSVNLLVEMKTDGTVLNKYSNVPGAAREGFVLVTDQANNRKNAYVAHDSSPSVTWHTAFAQTYFQDLDGDGRGSSITTTTVSLTPPAGYVSNYLDSFVANADQDYDNDGVITSLDCDDHNANLSAKQTFYQDQDGDGLGFGQPLTLCAAQAGLVTNNSDLNDHDYDNDGIETSVDCDDHNGAIHGMQSFYVDVDGDGLGFGAPQTSCIAMAGLVTNVLDQNDNDYDNDGVITSLDCDDHNADLSAKQTFYRDADQDGLGSKTAFVNACVNPNSASYVINNLDFDDQISTRGIEITGDLIDNDGDGTIDEVNTLTENGAHPYLKNFSPKSTSLAARYFLSVTPVSNGKIQVMFSDHSVYEYVAIQNFSGQPIATQYSRSAVIKIKRPNAIFSVTYLNAFNGARIYNPN